jgi:hypothetical protein
VRASCGPVLSPELSRPFWEPGAPCRSTITIRSLSMQYFTIWVMGWLTSVMMSCDGVMYSALSMPAAAAQYLPGRFHPQFRDKNRRDIGKSQSIWTDSKMETAGSPPAHGHADRVEPVGGHLLEVAGGVPGGPVSAEHLVPPTAGQPARQGRAATRQTNAGRRCTGAERESERARERESERARERESERARERES